MSKETIHDEQIAPLIDEILKICKAHKIAMVADFGLDDDLHCTSALLDDEYSPSAAQLAALRGLSPKPAVAFAETITTMPDGSKQVSIRRIS